VNALLLHLANAHAGGDPSAAQIKARQLLPEARLFPAFDPNAPQDVGKPNNDDTERKKNKPPLPNARLSEFPDTGYSSCCMK
jgi:hypothetical protein